MNKPNKNYHNYQNYQKNNKDNVEVTKSQETENIHSIMDDYLEQQSTVEETKTIHGVVIDCSKLRVRSEANSNADILCEIKLDTKVIIDEKNSTDEFYKVCTEAGVEGYCMKQFIAVK